VEQTRNLSAKSLSTVQLDISVVRLRRLKLNMNKRLKLNANKRLKLNANRRLKLNTNKRLSLNMEEIQIILFWSLQDVAVAVDTVMVDVVVLENNTR